MPDSLGEQVQQWPTPRVSAGNGGSQRERAEGNPKHRLETAAELWMTPTTRDAKDGADPTLVNLTNGLLGRQAPRTTRGGLLSLLPVGWISSRLRLNPRFVEWLMGLPEGWVTDVSGLAVGDQLRILGNGVVPQQGALAISLLIDDAAREFADVERSIPMNI